MLTPVERNVGRCIWALAVSGSALAVESKKNVDLESEVDAEAVNAAIGLS